jgi:hypothetical protein
MHLSSDDGLSRLELDVCELSLANPPALALFAKTSVHGFSGQQKAFFELTQLARFAAELTRLETANDGAAVLDSMAPDELRLTILAPDAENQCVAHLAVLARHRLGGREYETTLSGAFQLSLGSLRLAAETFRRWTDEKWLAELAAWGFDEQALLEDS